MVAGVRTHQKASRPSLAEELVLALSKPRTSKEPRGAISKNSSRTNNDDWINFLKKRKDNLSEPDGKDKNPKLEQTLKEQRQKLRETEEALHKEQQAHTETKRKSGNNVGQNDDIRHILTQEKKKNKGLLDELSSLRKKIENLEGKNEERIKGLQRENAGTVLELKELKAWKEEAMKRIASSVKFCENQHTSQIEKLRVENRNLEKLCDENGTKEKKMLKEVSLSLKKKEFEVDLLKGDLEKKNQIIQSLRTELDEMYVKRNINEGNGKNVTSTENVLEWPNKTLSSPNTSILKKRKRFSMESVVSVKKARAADLSDRDTRYDEEQNEVKHIKQEMVVLDETIEPEEATDTQLDFVEDILDEIFEKIDYIKQKPKTSEDLTVTDSSARESLDDGDDDCRFIRELLVSMIDNL